MNSKMNAAQNHKTFHKAVGNELDQRIDQLKIEAADAQEHNEEQETVFDGDVTKVMDNAGEDFH